MKKELLIYLAIFILFALIQHPDLLSHPLDRLQKLPTAGAYGIGAIHPIVFAFLGYLVVGIFRVFFNIMKNFFTRNNA